MPYTLLISAFSRLSIFASTSFDQLQDGIGGNSPIQLPQLLHYRLFEGELDSRGEPLDSFAAVEHCRARKLHEDRLGEVRVTEHQLTLGQGGHLDFGGRRDGGVPGRGELVHVHAAINHGAGIADNPAMDLGAELLSRKQHQPEIPAPLREIQ